MPPKRRQAALSTAAKRARTLPVPPSSERASSASWCRESSSLSRRASSPRQALAAASQATEPIQTFESQLLESQLEDEIVGPMEGSQAATAPTTDAGHGDGDGEVDADVDANDDDFTGIDWARLPDFMKPLSTQRRQKSWIYRHGYRVTEVKDPSKIWFVCRYCHQHKVIDAGSGGLFDVTKATTAAATHLAQQRRGHGYNRLGVRVQQPARGQLSLRQALNGGVKVSQHAGNAIGNFDIQRFRLAMALCLVDNNLPMELISRPSFREMIAFANPEAEAALWVSPRSVTAYALRLYRRMQPEVVKALSTAVSKVHISFDG